MNPIRRVSTWAISAPHAPIPSASAQIVTTRRSTGRYSGGACTVASASSIDGATGRPAAALSGVGSPSGTLRSRLRLVFAKHRRRRKIDLRGDQPSLEEIGQRVLIVAWHVA